MAYTTIKKPSDYFNTKLFTGTGSDNNAITGVGFQPDWIWFKNRSTANDHAIVDAVRGANKAISSNNNSGNITLNAGQDFDSFDSDGFTVDTPNQLMSFNRSGDNIVTWNWKANGQGSSNTDGSTNTIYTSVNTTAGLSISSYTGTGNAATIGHGLGVAPKMIIIKRTSDSDSWTVGHNSMGWGKYLRLDNNSAEASNTSTWNNTAPTSSVFSVNHADTNDNNRTFISYCFSEKTGYSKIGSYTGNGNADGTFVYTGFKPAFVLVKQSSAAGEGWIIHDSKRSGYNGDNDFLYTNTAGAEVTSSNHIDILSNGFKARSTNGVVNGSGTTYIYIAIAEEPLIGDNPATAR